MTNNDILRSLRYSLKINDKEMAQIANLAGPTITATQMEQFLKNEEDAEYKNCPSVIFSQFLNGLIYHKRGKDESKPPLLSTNKVSNNLVLKKLRIAFTLRDEDMIEIFKRGGQIISKTELTALFRSEEHINYSECQDQYLRKFLRGLNEEVSAKKS